MKRISKIAAAVALTITWAAALLYAQQAPASPDHGSQKQGIFLFADDAFIAGYGPTYKTPFVMQPNSPNAANIARTFIEFRHVDSWRLGENFADISLRKSNGVEPAAAGGTGALEPYAVLRTSLSYNKLTHSRGMTWGPLRDASLEVGANLESKNSSFAPEERTIYFGPVLHLKVPKGYLNVGLHLRKEWNHEGVLGKDENYSPDFNIEPTWSIPFAIHRVGFAFDGFADINTPKGKDSFGAPTATEFITRPFLWIDIGSLVHKAPHVLEAGAGFEYWKNEYGKSAQTVPGASELTPLIEVKIHLPISASRH